MIILRRSLLLYREDNQDLTDLYQSLRRDLKEDVAHWLALPGGSEALSDWPSGTWGDDTHSAECSEWITGFGGAQRLLQLALRKRELEYEWEIDSIMGRKGDDLVVVSEDWRISVYRHHAPVDEMPELFAFTTKYRCKNEDGYLANTCYTVSEGRVRAFVEFIQSPERRLPIILISPLPYGSKTVPIDHREISHKVRGLAHVIRLQDAAAVDQLRSLLPHHSCYGGAVRLYWPRFRPKDRPSLHPFWRRSEDPSAVEKDLFGILAKESPHFLGPNTDIAYLERLKNEQHREAQRRSQNTAIEAVKRRMEAERDAEEYVQLYEMIERERNEFKQRLDELEEENERLRDDNRRLSWRLATAWQRDEDLATTNEESVHVFLSEQVQGKLASLDNDERSYWNEHVWWKLLDKQLRDSQSEPVPGVSGTCRV